LPLRLRVGCWCRGIACTPPHARPKIQDLRRGRKDDVAWWDPQVGKENMETDGANCVLG
jgi:hypothetical protein